MTGRRRVATRAPWEATVGYSRAVRAGNLVYVSGTAPVGEDGKIAHRGDAYRQAQRCIEIITRALQELGAGPEHVVRTRMFIADRTHWQEVGRAHAEVFGAHRPATIMVVTGFVDADILVEIEADAVV
ncbi:MAG: RidA family protein [Gemmatimonadetes bacterium]|nr:RidA family protein [Gemmatimonadota bacterium]